jgi:hypothetical protein
MRLRKARARRHLTVRKTAPVDLCFFGAQPPSRDESFIGERPRGRLIRAGVCRS